MVLPCTRLVLSPPSRGHQETFYIRLEAVERPLLMHASNFSDVL